MRTLPAALIACCLAAPILADPPTTVEDDLGVLNPEDTGTEMLKRKIRMGVIDSVTCSLGINATKADNLELARTLTQACAEAGYAKAMTWMSQLLNNGMGGPYDPDGSAAWDRRAAEAGDPVGKFNHGLNLMRGHGTAMDMDAGRAMVDEAARDGLEIARTLQGAGYDLNAVTPDADNWKYGSFF